MERNSIHMELISSSIDCLEGISQNKLVALVIAEKDIIGTLAKSVRF